MSIIPPKKYTISIMVFDGIYSTMTEEVEFKTFKEAVEVLSKTLSRSNFSNKGEQNGHTE